jgi:hypothetical protein
LGILFRHLDGGRPGEEVQVEHAADCVVLEILIALGIFINDHIHAVGVEQEDAMAAACAVVKVDGVAAVEVHRLGDPVGVGVPQGADVICRVEAEGVCM